MSNAYRDKLLTIGYLPHGRSHSATVVEGAKHPASGAAYKATTDELGNTVTEHATPDDRVDVEIRPKPVDLILAPGEITEG